MNYEHRLSRLEARSAIGSRLCVQIDNELPCADCAALGSCVLKDRPGVHRVHLDGKGPTAENRGLMGRD